MLDSSPRIWIFSAQEVSASHPAGGKQAHYLRQMPAFVGGC